MCVESYLSPWAAFFQIVLKINSCVAVENVNPELSSVMAMMTVVMEAMKLTVALVSIHDHRGWNS